MEQELDMLSCGSFLASIVKATLDLVSAWLVMMTTRPQETRKLKGFMV